MKKIAIILFFIFLVFPLYKIHAQTSNAGFVPSNIWYSKDPITEGDKLKIYTLVSNHDNMELSGTVTFFDVNVFLGKKNFTVAAQGATTIYIDWIATAGDHKIFGKIENAKFLVSKGKYEEIYLTENETEKSEITIKKIITQAISKTTDTNTSTATTEDSSSLGTVQNIQNLIADKTPDFIAKPITITASAIDGFRESIGNASNNKKEAIKIEIKKLDDPQISVDLKNPKTISNNILVKPFDYVKLFFLTISSIIFNNKLIFYGLLAVVLFFLVRFIWRKIF